MIHLRCVINICLLNNKARQKKAQQHSCYWANIGPRLQCCQFSNRFLKKTITIGNYKKLSLLTKHLQSLSYQVHIIMFLFESWVNCSKRCWIVWAVREVVNLLEIDQLCCTSKKGFASKFMIILNIHFFWMWRINITNDFGETFSGIQYFFLSE